MDRCSTEPAEKDMLENEYHAQASRNGGPRDRRLLRRLTGALLLNYDVVEGTGHILQAVYIESTGSETDDEFSSGFQCRLFSLAARPTTMGASMGVTMVAQTATLVDGVLLLD